MHCLPRRDIQSLVAYAGVEPDGKWQHNRRLVDAIIDVRMAEPGSPLVIIGMKGSLSEFKVSRVKVQMALMSGSSQP